MKKTVILVFSLLMVTMLPAQTAAILDEGADIKFDRDVHNFGTVNEDGKITCTFTFENTGNLPLEIYKATASCGCTTPTYSELPVAPGEKGTIEVSYNTDGRPGAFNKSVTVYSNSRRHPSYSLAIRGTVVSKANSPASIYPKTIGSLRLKRTTLSLGEVKVGSIITETVPVYNDNATLPVHVRVTNVPKHIQVIVSNSEIAPSETGMLTVTFASAGADDYGRHEDFFQIESQVEGQEKVAGSIQVTCNLTEDFSKLKGDDKIPVVEYPEDVIDFGKVSQGRKVTTYFEVRNNGSAPLIIRKVVNYAPAMTAKAERKEVAPGKSVRVKVELNTEELLSSIKYYLEVIVNDPLMPRKRIAVVADIVE